MADAVSSTTILDGDRKAVIQITNLSAGTGESAVTKVDVSGLATNEGRTCTGVTIEKIWWQCVGMKVNILCSLCINGYILCICMYKTGFG